MDAFSIYKITPDQIVAQGNGWTIANIDTRWRADVFVGDKHRCCPWMGKPDAKRAESISERLCADFKDDESGSASAAAMSVALFEIANG